MERCQEISQCVPTIAEVTARTAHQTYHGVARTGPGNEPEPILFSDNQIIR